VERILRWIAGGVAGRPKIVVMAVVALTLVFGGFASQQSTDTDLTSFAPDSELSSQYDTIQEEFVGSGGTIQVIVDAGDSGDVLSPEGLAAARRIEQIALATSGVAEVLAPATDQNPAFVTYAMPLDSALVQQGIDAASLDAAGLDQVASAMLADPQGGPRVAALFSRDLDAATATARGGLILLRVSPDAEAGAVIDTALGLRDALEAEDFGAMSVSPFSEEILSDDMMQELNSELPMLLGLSLLLVVGILFFTYRRLSDVLLGFAGLIITIVWMYGLGVLLGPDYLGVTGAFSQIAIVVPVLLIGLGIDYAIHLTSRYREEQNYGLSSARSASVAITTVGGALVLATITTLVGFLTNVFSPLPPIADFGIFVAAGVLSAFVVMVTLVPASRLLLDRRAERRGSLELRSAGESNGLAKIMEKTAVLSERVPRTVLALALVIAVAAGIAGSQVSTTFGMTDFISEDSEIGVLMDDIEELFGGDIEERTYVLLEGDLATPDAANAMLAVHARLAGVADVRTEADQAQADSAGAVVAELAADPQVADRLSALGWNGSGFDPDGDVAGAFEIARSVAPEAIRQVVAADDGLGVISISTTAGQDRAGELADAVGDAAAPLADAGVTFTVVSESLILDEILDSLTASQTRSIVITLVAALLLLVAFFGIRDRRPLLGAVTMVPSAMVVTMVLGSMWVLGVSFNVLTATVASLAIGIGVPYGIHVTHRFLEERKHTESIDDAIRETVKHTGGALAGSAATTAAGFGVLGFASLVPIQQFGLITALTIAYSLLASVLVQPATLKLWAIWREGRDGQETRSVVAREREVARR